MEFRDLKKQYRILKPEIDEAVLKVMEQSNFISGSPVKELERELAKYVGVKHCITCANGTDALSLALMVWNIGQGDAVFVPDFTFFSSGEVVSFAGATPVFVDVEIDTYNISCEKLEVEIERVLSEGKLNPKVIITVDLFGLPADYKKLQKIADKYDLFILEDGAQGFGGSIDNKRACSFGDIATTSFFPAKPLGCFGDGGAIFTNNDAYNEYLRSVCIHGKGKSKYDNIRIGMNSRLDTMQAAVLLIKLRAFKDYELENITIVAERYTNSLKRYTEVPIVPSGFFSSWAQYCIRLQNSEERNAIINHLHERGIPTMIYYSIPMHRLKAFAEYNYPEERYKNTVSLCETVLEIPIHPYLDEEQDIIIAGITEYFEK